MFTREIQLKIIEELKQIKPKSYQDVGSWKQLDIKLSENIREIKECDYKFLRDYIVSDLLVEVKQNKLKLPREDVEKLCYPFLISLLNVKLIITRSPKILENISVEKIQRHKIILAYVLSQGKFNKDLWSKMHLISRYFPQEYHNINLNDPRYELSPANIKALNKLVFKEQKEKPTVAQTCIKWHEKRNSLKLKRAAPENDHNDMEIDLTYCSILHQEQTTISPAQRDQVQPSAAGTHNQESPLEIAATNTEPSSQQNTKMSSSLCLSCESESDSDDLDSSKWLKCNDDREFLSEFLRSITSSHRNEIRSDHSSDEELFPHQLFGAYDFEKEKEKIVYLSDEDLGMMAVSSDDSFSPSIIFNEESNSDHEDNT